MLCPIMLDPLLRREQGVCSRHTYTIPWLHVPQAEKSGNRA